MQIAVGVYAFVVVKNQDNQIDITEDYQKLFNSYNENKEIIDFVQSSVSTFTYYYFVKFREFFDIGRSTRKSFWFWKKKKTT